MITWIAFRVGLTPFAKRPTGQLTSTIFLSICILSGPDLVYTVKPTNLTVRLRSSNQEKEERLCGSGATHHLQ
jgi:hypothetical protein